MPHPKGQGANAAQFLVAPATGDMVGVGPRTTEVGMVIHAGTAFLRCQPRHCICTNASRGLSAIAKFLFSDNFGEKSRNVFESLFLQRLTETCQRYKIVAFLQQMKKHRGGRTHNQCVKLVYLLH